MKEGCRKNCGDRSRGKRVYTATGNSWQGEWSLDTKRGPKVSMSCPLPDKSPAFCFTKNNESLQTLLSLESGVRGTEGFSQVTASVFLFTVKVMEAKYYTVFSLLYIY